jgi:hypothetical protein
MLYRWDIADGVAHVALGVRPHRRSVAACGGPVFKASNAAGGFGRLPATPLLTTAMATYACAPP